MGSEKRHMQTSEAADEPIRQAPEIDSVRGPYGALLPSEADMKAEIQAGREKSLAPQDLSPPAGLKTTEEYAAQAAALRNSRHTYGMGGD